MIRRARRFFFRWTWCAALLATAWGGARAGAAEEAQPGVASSPGPPNILFVLADDLGYGDVGCYNDESKIPTPRLDALAREGMRFTDAHSPSTVCTPSRYSLLTGRMCFRTGMRGVFTGVDGPLLEPDRLTVAGLLRDHGYRTACVGKWHVGMTFFDRQGRPVAARGGGVEKVREVDFERPIANGPCDAGFDYFFGTACCPTTDWLYAYIRNDRVVQAPTELVRPATDHWLEYAHFRTGLRSPDFNFEEVDLVFLRESVAFLERHAAADDDRPFFLLHCTQTAHLPALPAPRFHGATNAGPLGDFIYEFDFVVGQLLDTLERLELDEDTLVIISSDNGPEIVVRHLREVYGHDSARPWRGLKRDNWEGGHRVPMIARWPGRIPAESVCRETVCLTDFMATAAALVESELPDDAGEDSFNLLPWMLGSPPDHPPRPFTLHQTMSNALGIRKGPWKLLAHRGSGGNNYDQEYLRDYRLPDTDPDATAQLYHLERDPGETQNVFRMHPDLSVRLLEQLEAASSAGRSRDLNEADPGESRRDGDGREP